MNGIRSLAASTIQSVDVAHLIQVALTPIFLISAIGVTLNVLTSRLARIVDRARAMEDILRRPDHKHDGRDLHGALVVLARRSSLESLQILADRLHRLVQVEASEKASRSLMRVALSAGRLNCTVKPGHRSAPPRFVRHEPG